VTTSGPGYCLFSFAYQQEFFNQLTSEEVCTLFVFGHPVRYWFKPSGKRNEALDRRVYALAALHSRPVPWEVLLRVAPHRTAAITARRRRPARTAAASRCMDSSGNMTICVMPSLYELFSCNTTWPARLQLHDFTAKRTIFCSQGITSPLLSPLVKGPRICPVTFLFR
jgi:hypothetical protein